MKAAAELWPKSSGTNQAASGAYDQFVCFAPLVTRHWPLRGGRELAAAAAVEPAPLPRDRRKADGQGIVGAPLLRALASRAARPQGGGDALRLPTSGGRRVATYPWAARRRPARLANARRRPRVADISALRWAWVSWHVRTRADWPGRMRAPREQK